MIIYDSKKYHLTPMGKTIVKNFKPFVNTINVFDQNWEWWEEHDISSIPDEMLFRIGELKNYIIIEDGLNDIDRTRAELTNIINNSTHLYGITCTFSDEYPEIFLNIAKNNIPTNIVIDNKIYCMLEKKYNKELGQFLNVTNSGMYVCDDDIKISVVITDKYLFFTLNYKSGKLDLQSNIVSDDISSIKWGLDLFEYYKVKSKKVN